MAQRKREDGEKQMNKFIIPVLLCSITSTSLFVAYEYNGSTTAAVTLAGAVVSAQHINIEKKYKRKDCPICKGKGWYMSGDDISKVDCGYCEPETTESIQAEVIIKKCKNPNCQCKNCDCKNCGCLSTTTK